MRLHKFLVIYGVVITVRFAMIYTHGYLHPDEFFQAQEVFAVRDRTLDVQLPWEFKNDRPCRSFFMPEVAAGLPIRLAAAFQTMLGFRISAETILHAPRYLAFANSFLLDYAAYHLSERCGEHWQAVLLCLATSWPVLFLCTRPFSNTYETEILWLVTLLITSSSRNRITAMFTGGLTAVGVFIRFTFILYAWPLFLYIFLDQHDRKRAHIASLILGFLFSSITLIFLDSLYFGKITLHWDQMQQFFISGHISDIPSLASKHLVISPINSFLYNLNSKNLETHGLHPRITHIVVNAVLMFGPLYILSATTLLKSVYHFFKFQQFHRTSYKLEIHYKIRICLTAMASSGICLLSLAPHQEPRFLLPMIVPLCVLCGNKIFGAEGMRSHRIIMWMIFNALLIVFFGFLHQAGITKVLSWLEEDTSAICAKREGRRSMITRHVIWSHTYMPPVSSLLSMPSALGVLDVKWSSLDLAGGDLKRIQHAVNTIKQGEVFVILPGSIDHNNDLVNGSKCILYKSIFPHLSTEDAPSMGASKSLQDQLTLDIYDCTKR
mmetsp:Transcript_17436/g.57680  ORF Transcript_17436/g.57680 Transcript_17436/m.57680 type:complete len:550 (-) Transcript_17436:20-1669(-)